MNADDKHKNPASPLQSPSANRPLGLSDIATSSEIWNPNSYSSFEKKRETAKIEDESAKPK